MNSSVFVSGKAPEGWNEFLSSSPFGTFYQTSFYADYAEKDSGLKPLFLQATSDGKITGELLLLKGSRFQSGLANLPFSSVTTRVARTFFPSFSWIYGPVANSAASAKELLLKAEILSGGKISGCSPHPMAGSQEAFRASGFNEKKWATFLIDLSKSEDELWKNVDKAARKIVNRTLEQVEVRVAENENEYGKCLAVVNENRRRGGFIPYKSMPWKAWRESNTGDIFVAMDKAGRVLACLGVSFFNGWVNEWGAGTSTYALENHVYAQDAIKWSVIKWAKEKGFRYFDFTGVNPEPKDEKEKGIYRFKEKWGGKLVGYPLYSREPTS
jgi:hypothetical protein